MRRVSVVPVVLAMLLALPGVVSAAPPERFSDDRWMLSCDGLDTGDGRTIFLAADVSQVFGSFGSLNIWAPGTIPFEDPPAVVSADAEVGISGSVLTASFEMWEFDPTAEPPLGAELGTAELSVVLTPLGDPQAFDFQTKEGNRLIRATGSRQAFSVAGDLTLHDGTVVDLSSCFADHVIETFFGTNPAQVPASFVSRLEGIQLNCSWEVDDTFVGLFASADAFGVFSDLFVDTGEGSFSGFSDDVVLTSTEYSAAFELSDDGGAPAGSAMAGANLTPTGDRIRLVDRFPDGSFKLIGERLSVDGELAIEVDGGAFELVMDDETCMAVDGRTISHFVDPRGPKGKPLANDAPDGAVPLAVGDSDRVITGGNAPEPEAPCLVEDPETGEPVEFPIGFTAWWSFVGTGGEVTVSTAGSDYDTVLGVYRLEGDGLVPLACVDDVFEPEFSLQAEVTLLTDAGATYLIQAGGFFDSTGKLVVSLE
jgi:hypothetical protein